MDYVPLTNYRVDLKESKKRDKHLNLARELKKLWSMKMTVVPVVIRAREADVKSREKEKKKLKTCRRVGIRRMSVVENGLSIFKNVWLLK